MTENILGYYNSAFKAHREALYSAHISVEKRSLLLVSRPSGAGKQGQAPILSSIELRAPSESHAGVTLAKPWPLIILITINTRLGHDDWRGWRGCSGCCWAIKPQETPNSFGRRENSQRLLANIILTIIGMCIRVCVCKIRRQTGAKGVYHFFDQFQTQFTG